MSSGVTGMWLVDPIPDKGILVISGKIVKDKLHEESADDLVPSRVLHWSGHSRVGDRFRPGRDLELRSELGQKLEAESPERV